jgi:hypothetical protein
MQFLALLAIAAIALSPILNAMGELSDVHAWLGFFGGISVLMFGLGQVLDDWLYRLERMPPRATRIRRSGRVLTTR